MKINSENKLIDSSQQQPRLNIQGIQQFYLNPSDTESQDQNKCIDSTTNVYNPKLKKVIIIPYNMHKDYQTLLSENNTKKKLLSQLIEQNKILKQQQKIKEREMREAEQVLYKVSSVLPQRKQKIEKYYITQQKKIVQKQELKVREQLHKIKRRVKYTQNKEYEIYLQEIRKYRNYLRSGLNLFNSNNNYRTCQINHQIIDQIENQKYRAEQTLRKEYILQNQVTITLKQKELNKLQHLVKQLRHKLEQKKIQTQGLEYECSILINQKNSIPSLEFEIKKYEKLIEQKEERIITLKKILDERTKSLQYINKWTDQLKVCLQQKKKYEIQIKQKLENRINSLTKEFQEWNSKYKSLQLQDVASKIKRTKQFKNSENVRHVPNRIKFIKIYEIIKLCKKINYSLTIRNTTLEEFIGYLIGKQSMVTMKYLYEKLKSIEYICQQPDLIKFARYIIQDNNKQSTLSYYSSVDKNIAADIIKNMIGPILNGVKYREQIPKIKKMMQKYYQPLRQQLQGLNKIQFFNEQKLLEGINFLNLKEINQSALKIICIQLFEISNEVDNYSILSFKKCFYNPNYIREDEEDMIQI